MENLGKELVIVLCHRDEIDQAISDGSAKAIMDGEISSGISHPWLEATLKKIMQFKCSGTYIRDEILTMELTYYGCKEN